MQTYHLVLLGALFLIVVLIAYSVWRNAKVKTTFSLGPIKVNLDTERTTPQEELNTHSANALQHHLQPTAQITAGDIRRSQVINEGSGGSVEMKVKDIVGSTVINTAGKVHSVQAQNLTTPAQPAQRMQNEPVAKDDDSLARDT
ncbi:MAG: hypothetical protein NZM18_08790 [Thermoflexales bacterium]|nr:hypothetical protein [Thermoflexales bacterium]